jgi:hypothetical protein
MMDEMADKSRGLWAMGFIISKVTFGYIHRPLRGYGAWRLGSGVPGGVHFSCIDLAGLVWTPGIFGGFLGVDMRAGSGVWHLGSGVQDAGH